MSTQIANILFKPTSSSYNSIAFNKFKIGLQNTAFEKKMEIYTRHLCMGYTSSRLNAQNCAKLGLQKNKTEIEKLLAQRDLKKLLTHIWAEGNSLYKITWLKKATGSWSHPLLFLELYFALLQEITLITNQEDRTQLYIEAETARLLGIKLSKADASCFKDATVLKIVEYVQGKYFQIDPNIKNFLEKNDYKKIVQSEVNESLKVLLQKPTAFSNPIWLSKEPLGIFLGVSPIPFLRSKCIEQQKAFLENSNSLIIKV